MSSLILPRQFTSQPQGAVELIYPSISRSVGKPFDLARNIPLSVFGDASQGVGYSGLYLAGSSAANSYGWDIPALSLGTSFTLIAVVDYPTYPVNGLTTILDNHVIGTGHLQFRLAADTSTVYAQLIRFNTSGSAYQASAAVHSVGISGRQVCIVGASDGNSIRIHSKGIGQSLKEATGTITGTPSSSTQTIRLGNTKLDVAATALGKVYFHAILPYAISSAEAINIVESPWKIFRAPKRVLYFDAGGVGGGASATLNSSGSLILSGASSFFFGYSNDSSGSIAFNSSSSVITGRSFSSSGDLTFDGAASEEHSGTQSQTNNASGSLSFLEGAVSSVGVSLDAVGSIAFNQGASISYSVVKIPTGSLLFSGNAGNSFGGPSISGSDFNWRSRGYGR